MTVTSGGPPEAADRRALLAGILKERAAAGATSTFPLSHGQRALWFIQQMSPGSSAYTIAFAAAIRSGVNVAALRSALQVLVDRHGALRMSCVVQGGEPMQVFAPQQAVELAHNVLGETTDERLRQAVDVEVRRPFDLASGPIFRATLFSRSDTDHVLLLTLHHIAGDLWSLAILMDELRQVYPALAAGRAPDLRGPPAGYDEYVRWQESLLSSEAGERLGRYWSGQLAGCSGTLALPLDHPRPRVPSLRGASHPVRFSPELVAAVRAFARAEKLTVNALTLSVFQVLLHRYSGQETVLVGTPALGRTRNEFLQTLGYFVNPLVVRADCGDDPPFRQFAARTRDTLVAAMDHQDLPFPLLVDRLKVSREPGVPPLFQVLFVHQKPQLGQDVAELFAPGSEHSGRFVTMGDVRVEPYHVDQQEGQFDLQLEVGEMGEALFGTLKYSTDLFTAETVERLATHYVELLRNAVAEPERRIGAIPMLGADERERVVERWNDTARPYDLGATLIERIEQQAQRTPDATALIFRDRRLTYRELDERATALARVLAGEGLGPERFAGVCLERSTEMVVALLAILKAGAAYVPFDPGYPADRLAFMIQDSGVPVIVSDRGTAPALAGCPCRVILADGELPAAPAGAPLPQRGGPDSAAYMIYTSGSTGKPKGAINTNLGIVNRLLWMQEAFRLDAGDRVLQKTPFSFDVSVWEFFWPLMTGACLVVAEPGGHRDSGYLTDVIRRERITTIHFVPSMLRLFLEHPDAGACSSLERVICSGEALGTQLQETFFGIMGAAELHNLYGPTEAAVDVSWWPCSRGAPVRIGRPIANTSLYVLDRHMNPVPEGVAGELHIGGVQVGRGYHDRPELTRERFVPNPFGPGTLYKTGDLVRFVSGGDIDYLGRIDFQVKVRGFRIELGDIEACLEEREDIAASVVVAIGEGGEDKTLAAYYVVQGAEPSVDELRRYLRSKLPDYMVPAHLEKLDAMPLSPNGKVDRRRLPRPRGGRSGAGAAYVQPRNDLESRICAIWMEVLKVETVGVDDNFFDLGGHSLLLARVHAKVAQLTEKPLSIVDLFEHPTVAALAGHLTREGGGGELVQESAAHAARRREALAARREKRKPRSETT
jgi:amino acid adenylation domain-containing protein